MKVSLLLAAMLTLANSGLVADDKKPAPSTSGATPAEKSEMKVTDVTPDAAEKLLKEKKDVVVLDVRTPEEFEAGHIAGAKNVDYQGKDFAKALGALDKNQPVILHCGSGGRSTRALKQMDELGFKTIYHMNGGFRAWTEAGKPVEK